MNRCGYTFPADHEVGDIPNQQSCCWREIASDEVNRCIWHANPDEVTKSSDKIQSTRINGAGCDETISDWGLLDGANLAGVKLGDDISFKGVSLRDADFSGAVVPGADFSSANLSRANLSDANLRKAVFSDADLRNTNLSSAKLRRSDFANANLRKSNLSYAYLGWADFSDANLRQATLDDADLRRARFPNAVLPNVDLSGMRLTGALLADANLRSANLKDAHLAKSNLSGAELGGADLSQAMLRRANLSNANLRRADLSDTSLQDGKLINTNLEQAVLIRTNLFNADLTDSKPHGATFTDVQINGSTTIRSPERREQIAKWWQRGFWFPRQRCRYDPLISNSDEAEESDIELVGKAADTYQTFEIMARQNSRPSLQSEMFVLRQDMQRLRHKYNNEHGKWTFSSISRTIFLYGESLGRIFTWGILLVVAYAALYLHLGLIASASTGEIVNEATDAVYFSMLTFTTLGFGDFQPSPASELSRLLVTTQAALGTVLIAIFVFVLGRRAAR